MTDAEWGDAFASYTLALAVMREQAVRKGDIRPRNKVERKWAAEGERPPQELDTVSGATNNAKVEA